MEERRNIGTKNPLPSPIQCRWEIDADDNLRGRAWTDGTRSDRRDAAWSNRMLPRHGPPLPHARRKNQGAPACRRLSASPGRTMKRPGDGTPIKGSPTGLLGRSDGPGKTTNERPPKDKHLCLLTLSLISLPSLRPQQRQGHGHRSRAAESVCLFRHPLRPTPPYV